MLTFRKADQMGKKNTQRLPMRLTVAPGPSVSGRDWRERESSSQRQNQLSREELR